MQRVKLLTRNLINKIAAGEVLERPSSAVKELVENSLDARSNKIQVFVRNGGKTEIKVIDNGTGMSKDDLKMAIMRHATSKFNHENFSKIKTHGFRGEALPSIGSIANLVIESYDKLKDEAWKISSINNKKNIEPSLLRFGTKVTITDLFLKVPARLKFMKTNATEIRYCKEVVKHLAMSHPKISFSLTIDSKRIFNWEKSEKADFEGTKNRLYQVMGEDFIKSSVSVHIERDGLILAGMVGMPTLNRNTGREQYLFVNNRPVKDRNLIGALRGAYKGLIEHNRFPVAVLFLDIISEDVDINVHPAKVEVRFKEPGKVRSIIVSGVRKALEKAGWSVADLDLIESNEAFAAQSCAVNKEMGWDTSKVNVNGGAIAIGHPIGASGARILVTLLNQMKRQDAKKGLATLCIGGGMGVALCVER